MTEKQIQTLVDLDHFGALSTTDADMRTVNALAKRKLVSVRNGSVRILAAGRKAIGTTN